MIDLVTNNLQNIRAACEDCDVDSLWVFGSAVRDDWVEGKSDIDFIAQFGQSERSLFRQHMGFIVRLNDLLGTNVDVIDSRSIKREDFREEVEKTKELIYDRTRHAILT